MKSFAKVTGDPLLIEGVHMSTETTEKLDINVKEEVDGSAVVDLPEDLVPEEEQQEQKAEGGSVPDDGGEDIQTIPKPFVMLDEPSVGTKRNSQGHFE